MPDLGPRGGPAMNAARRSQRAGRWAAWLGAWMVIGAAAAAAAEAPGPGGGDVSAGRELFLREWTPGDPRSHGGDGLGPVFNDTSCVACHNAGAPGGGGPASKNVDIISAAANVAQQQV